MWARVKSRGALHPLQCTYALQARDASAGHTAGERPLPAHPTTRARRVEAAPPRRLWPGEGKVAASHTVEGRVAGQ